MMDEPGKQILAFGLARRASYISAMRYSPVESDEISYEVYKG